MKDGSFANKEGLVAAVAAGVGALLMPAIGAHHLVEMGGWLARVIGICLLALVVAEAFELLELRRIRSPFRISTAPTTRPFVSVHIPTCSEPPDLVERTLRALHASTYEPLEVLVVDNNTHDEALWRPIEALCAELGPRFRFFHLATWPGYKAGALNFALSRTAAEASVIAVIDSDYEVSADFPEHLVGHLEEPRVGFVQAPQDYREWQSRLFTRMCYWEYWQFFAVSMNLRHPRNAILLHGTMSLIRKKALLDVGGWAEWCVTEDSELGLRLLAAGYRGVYCATTLGHGLVPFSITDYRRQRARWVSGGMQTLWRHRRMFMPTCRDLSLAQKLHYLQGWAPWLRDGLLVAATPLALAMACIGTWLGDPTMLTPLSMSIVVVVIYLVTREYIVYRRLLRLSWRDSAGAALAIVGLMPTVGMAVIRKSLRLPAKFRRTPKFRSNTSRVAGQVAWEIATAVALIAAAAGLLWSAGIPALMPAAGLACLACVYLSSSASLLADASLPA